MHCKMALAPNDLLQIVHNKINRYITIIQPKKYLRHGKHTLTIHVRFIIPSTIIIYFTLVWDERFVQYH
jgi:hypothetical protein